VLTNRAGGCDTTRTTEEFTMPDAIPQVKDSKPLWSGWGPATVEQREHFATPAGRKAWSRVCGGCGQGDFVARKQKPSNASRVLQGRAFPALPEPVLEEGARRGPFRTPSKRLHLCVTESASLASRRR
jgi:hypothetical protein